MPKLTTWAISFARDSSVPRGQLVLAELGEEEMGAEGSMTGADLGSHTPVNQPLLGSTVSLGSVAEPINASGDSRSAHLAHTIQRDHRSEEQDHNPGYQQPKMNSAGTRFQEALLSNQGVPDGRENPAHSR